MRRWLLLVVALLPPLFLAPSGSPEHEPCVAVNSRAFRQGMNFLIRGEVRNRCPYEVRDLRVTLEAVDGERRPLADAGYAVSPSSLAPGGMASFAGVVRTPEGTVTGAARVSWSHD